MEIQHDSLRNNLKYQTFYQILSIILPLITMPYVSRILSPDGIGLYSYTNSIMYFFLIFANLGISNYGIRTISESDGDRQELSKAFWGVYICHIFVTIISFLVYAVFIVFFCKENFVAFICQGLQLIACFFDISWFFSGIQKFRITVLRNLVVRMISLLCIFIFIKTKEDVWKYILIIALGNVIGQIIVWTQLKKYIDFAKVSIKEIFSHLKPMIILFIPIVAISIYRYMDKIMISEFSSLAQLGMYENSEKIITLPLSIITAMGIVFLPKMTNLITDNNIKDFNYYFESSMELGLILASAMTFGLIGIAPIFAPVFFGTEFAECSNIISALASTIFLLTWSNSIRSQYLIPKKKDFAFILSVSIGAVVNLIFNLIFIPKLGAMGAVFGTIIAELFVAVIQTFFSMKELRIGKMILSGLFYLVPGVIMMLVVRFIGIKMGVKVTTLIVQVLIGIVIYCSLSFTYMRLTHNNLLNSILVKFKRNKKK